MYSDAIWELFFCGFFAISCLYVFSFNGQIVRGQISSFTALSYYFLVLVFVCP